LKLITISQIMAVPKCSSYDTDSMPNLLDLMKSSRKPVNTVANSGTDLPILQDFEVSQPSNTEQKGIYFLAGWIAFKLYTKLKECSNCWPHITTDEPTLPQSSLRSKMSYGGYKHPSNELFYIIMEAEMFIRNHDVSSSSKEDIAAAIVSQLDNQSFDVCQQHKLLDLIIKQYLNLRIHVHGRFVTEQLNLQEQKQYASRSAASRTTIQ